MAVKSLQFCISITLFAFCHQYLILQVAMGTPRDENHSNNSDNQNSTCVPKCDQQNYESPNDISFSTPQAHIIACQPFDVKSIYCFNDKTYLKVGFCSTYNEKNNIVSVGLCPYFELGEGYNVSKLGSYWYIQLPGDMLSLNDYMCNPLNRKGQMCSECKDGYAPSPMSVGFQIQCSNCTGVWYVIPLYLFLEFFPVTVFFLVILMFQINITSAPMTCYIMCVQVTVLAWDHVFGGDSDDIHNIVLAANESSRMFLKVVLTLYDVWNLHFFRYLLPPFCVFERLKPITAVFIRYISAFYPLCLLILTWISIRLHDCNSRPFNWLWRPFRICLVRLRREVDTTSGLVNVFASIFLLSFTRVMFQAECLLTYQWIKHYRHKHSADYKYLGFTQAVEVDLSMPYGSTEHLLYSIPAGLFCIIFNVLPVLLLILYPFKIFQELLSKCRLNGIAIYFFVEKFYGCYRNGLEGGRDMRSFAVLYFVTRFALFLTNATANLLDISTFDPYFSRNIVFIITALMIALFRPYKKMYMNIMDTCLLAYMGIFCHLMSSHYGFRDKSKFLITTEIVISAPLCGFVLFFCIRSLQHACTKRQVEAVYLKLINFLKNSGILKVCAHFCRSNEDENLHLESDITVAEMSNDYGAINIYI